jgi:hypothetical protein
MRSKLFGDTRDTSIKYNFSAVTPLSPGQFSLPRRIKAHPPTPGTLREVGNGWMSRNRLDLDLDLDLDLELDWDWDGGLNGDPPLQGGFFSGGSSRGLWCRGPH